MLSRRGGRRDRVPSDNFDRSGRVVPSGGGVFRGDRGPTDGGPMVVVGRRRAAIRNRRQRRRRLPNKGQEERRRRFPADGRRQQVQERATAVAHDFGHRVQVPTVRHYGRLEHPMLQAHRAVHGATERLQTLGDKK